MMASCTMLGAEARLAKTDAVLLFTVVAAMSALARVYLASRATGEARPGLTLLAIFWTALAGGILIKGPLILMIVGLAAATLSIIDRSARWLLALDLPASPGLGKAYRSASLMVMLAVVKEQVPPVYEEGITVPSSEEAVVADHTAQAVWALEQSWALPARCCTRFCRRRNRRRR
jgi:hypothetical protein